MGILCSVMFRLLSYSLFSTEAVADCLWLLNDSVLQKMMLCSLLQAVLRA